MKLASIRNGRPDGTLAVVSRDLGRAVMATDIAPDMITAIETWDQVQPALSRLSDDLNAGRASGSFTFDPAQAMAPLPRARQFLDASAFLNHGRLMDTAFGMEGNPDLETIPMVYQGLSDDFRGPTEQIEFPDTTLGIDFEGEFGVILGRVPMGATPDQAAGAIRLLVQLNDWSLRALAAREMRVGFGWVQAKPTCSFAPVAITPDELGAAWQDSRIHCDLNIWRGDDHLGHANGREMHFSFADLAAWCARTRTIHPSAVLGSGTVASTDRSRGSSCLSEVRALEIIAEGKPRTEFLSFGERIRMEARLPDGQAPFGTIDSTVAQQG